MKYTILLNDKGERLTSLVENIHFNAENKEQVLNKFKETLGATEIIEVDGFIQYKLLQGYTYSKGILVKPQVSEEAPIDRLVDAKKGELLEINLDDFRDDILERLEALEDTVEELKGE